MRHRVTTKENVGNDAVWQQQRRHCGFSSAVELRLGALRDTRDSEPDQFGDATNGRKPGRLGYRKTSAMLG
jgi:hypothetical protein